MNARQIKFPKDRIILPLDVSSFADAAHYVKILAPYVGPMKVGLELLMAEGTPQVVQALHAESAAVFVDIKLHDIPTTVGRAANNISRLNVKMFNVHASGGFGMMKAAVANKRDCLVLAVTILTSMDDDTCQHMYGMSAKGKVMELALEAFDAGVDGIICSPQEIEPIRSHSLLRDMLLVTPGVRPSWAVADDQKRTMTPGEAIRAGADYLVIGRPILRPPPSEVGSCIEAAQRIADEIKQALS